MKYQSGGEGSPLLAATTVTRSPYGKNCRGTVRPRPDLRPRVVRTRACRFHNRTIRPLVRRRSHAPKRADRHLSYRDVEELLVERGVEVDHVTV